MLSTYFSEDLWTDASELRQLFFKACLGLDVKTILSLQKPPCENF